MSASFSPSILVQSNASGAFESRSIRDATRGLVSGRLDYEAQGKLACDDEGTPVPQLLAELDNYYGSVLGIFGQIYPDSLNAAIFEKTNQRKLNYAIAPCASPVDEANMAAIYLNERFAGGLPSLFIEKSDAPPKTRFNLPEPEYSTIPIAKDSSVKRESQKPAKPNILRTIAISLLGISFLIVLSGYVRLSSSSEDSKRKVVEAKTTKVTKASNKLSDFRTPSSSVKKIQPQTEILPPPQWTSNRSTETFQPSTGGSPLAEPPSKNFEDSQFPSEETPTTDMGLASGPADDALSPDPTLEKQEGQPEEKSREDSVFAEVQQKLNAHEDKFKAAKAILDLQYVKLLKREEEKQISNGDINAVIILRQEMQSVEEATELPPLGQVPQFLAEKRSKYQQLINELSRDKETKLLDLKRKIRSDLVSLQEDMTRAGRIKEAIQARDLIEDLREGEDDPVPVKTKPVRIGPRAKDFRFEAVQRNLKSAGSFINLSVTDANGDNRVDLLATDAQSGQLHFFEQRKPLIFEPSRRFRVDQISPPTHWHSFGLSDLDSDGKKELLASSIHRESFLLLDQKLSLSSFSEAENSGLKIVPTHAPFLFGDINGDGFMDICVYTLTSPTHGEFPVFYANNGFGKFRALEIFAPWEQVSRIEDIQLIDFDLDADLDMILTDRTGLKVFRNEGAGEFLHVTAEVGLFRPAHSTGAWGDVDNDGDLDVVISCKSEKQCRLFLQGDDGQFQDASWSTEGSADSLALADFNADGYLDLLRADAKEGQVLIYPSDAEEGFGNPTDISPRFVSPSGLIATVSDVDGDADEDVILSNWGVGIQILENKSEQRRKRTLVIVAETANRPNPDGAIVRLFSYPDRQFQQMRVINSGTSKHIGQRDAVFHGVSGEMIVEVVFPGGETASRRVFPAVRSQSLLP